MSSLAVTPGMKRMPNLAPLTAKQLRDADTDKSYIYNVTSRVHRQFACGRHWTIPACAEGENVSEPLVVPGVVYETAVKKVNGLDVDYEWIGTDGTDVAKDIIGTAPFKDASENLTTLGVFIAVNGEATPGEIVKAREVWLDRCSEKVAEADRLYSVNNGMVDLGQGRTGSNISAEHREAAKVLGISRPWADKHMKMLTCEECGTPNMPSASRCKECRCIFDEAKARVSYPEMFAAEAEPERQKRAYNRKEVVA